MAMSGSHEREAALMQSMAGRLGTVGRLLARLIRVVAAPFGALAGFVHVAAPAAGVAQTSADSEGMHPSAIGGAMIAGAGREIGKATNEMPDEHDPERDWLDPEPPRWP
jgi:hypothetical protein